MRFGHCGHEWVKEGRLVRQKTMENYGISKENIHRRQWKIIEKQRRTYAEDNRKNKGETYAEDNGKLLESNGKMRGEGYLDYRYHGREMNWARLRG